MGKLEVEQLKYYKIVLDSTWSGIRELKENTGESIKNMVSHSPSNPLVKTAKYTHASYLMKRKNTIYYVNSHFLK